MKVRLAYGKGYLTVDVPERRCTVIEPAHTRGVPDERGTFKQALATPIGSPALKSLLRPNSRVCIIFTDVTRATPNERIIPWLLKELSALPRENIVLLNALGTHRPNSREELERLLTPEVVRGYHVLNHEPKNPSALVRIGQTRDGNPVLLNRHCVQADLRIVTGFIEPHFFAGFSGGPKGIMPGVAGLETVMSNHGTHHISSANATFGVTAGNPLWEELRDVALSAGPSFLVNVTLNEQREITGVFAGHIVQAHQAGCEFVRASAMQRCESPFDLVVTTNSGYPLDMNLYQGVKGMATAGRILKPGGTMLLACECSEGVPANSPYDLLLRSVRGPRELLERLSAQSQSQPEQWQAQIQALIQTQTRVLLYSSMPEETVRAAHLEPCDDISAALNGALRENPSWKAAILPHGPLTIPYLA